MYKKLFYFIFIIASSLLVAFFAFTINETDKINDTNNNSANEGPIDLVGIMGVYDETDFSKIKNSGAKTIGLAKYASSEELQNLLEKAKSLDLNIGGRAEDRKEFQTSDFKIDLNRLEILIGDIFLNNNIAEDKNFAFYYIIDEPCHPNKWNITLEEFKQFYSTIKNVDPNIQVFVNFGQLSCLESFIPKDCSDWKITDIAAFTITERKLNRYNDYLKNENSIAAKAKECDPNIKIIPLVAAYEYPEQNLPLPSAEWIRKIGLETLNYNNFDGLMYFPWNPSNYMGDTIKDTIDDPAYKNSFIDVFKKAKIHL